MRMKFNQIPKRSSLRSIEEHEMVELIGNFIDFKYEALTKTRNADLAQSASGIVDDFLAHYQPDPEAHPTTRLQHIYDPTSISQLKESLIIQTKAMVFANTVNDRESKNPSYSNAFSQLGFLPLNGCTGLEELAMIGVVNCVLCVGVVLTSIAGILKDIYETANEIYHGERVKANVGTLALTGCIVIIGMALAASNPVSGGLLAGMVLLFGMALLIKGARTWMNNIDAAKAEKTSGLVSDSRFQLSTKEEIHLIKVYGQENIGNIKECIRGLAFEAGNTPKTGVFGTKTKYLEIIDTLRAVKAGNIPEDLRQKYGIPERKDARNNRGIEMQPVSPLYTKK